MYNFRPIKSAIKHNIKCAPFVQLERVLLILELPPDVGYLTHIAINNKSSLIIKDSVVAASKINYTNEPNGSCCRFWSIIMAPHTCT